MSTLLLLSLAPPANAFAPSDEVHIGIEPVRTHQVNIERQLRFEQGHPWQEWVQSEGAGWQAVFDERTGTPWSMWGAGIPMDTTDLEGEILALLERHPGLTGVSQDDLVLRSLNYVERTDTWYVSFDRRIEGVPVWRGGVEAFVKQDKLVMLKVRTHPHAALPNAEPEGDLTQPAILGAENAIQIAMSAGPASGSEHSVEGAELVVLPRNAGSGIAYDLAWMTRTTTSEPPGIWVSFVDAHSGELHNVHNEVRFLQGTIYGIHDTRTVNGDTSTSPIPLAPVISDDDTTRTDFDGVFDIGGSGPYFTEFDGNYVRVRNGDGAEGEGWLDGSAYTWTTADATQAEIDSYVFVHQVKAWAEEIAPEVGMVNQRLTSNVNLNSSCNAYYDGSLNFYKAGGGCNNTGRIADVAYHEWGHGFHYYSLEAGSWDGSMGEGIGDVVAFLQTGDPLIAPYFATSGSGIRRVDQGNSYPDDLTGEVHYDGLIFAGAVWDWQDALADEVGYEEANAIVAQVFADAIKSGPTIPESYDAFALADDDDGNLNNGTPHACSLLEGFALHGLGPGGSTGGTLFYVGHIPLANQAPYTGEYVVGASITNLAEGCVDFALDSAKLHWSVDGENWETESMQVEGDDSVTGAIPEQEPGTLVHYFVSVEDDTGQNAYSPTGGPINPHTFWVGELIEIYCEDFEASDGGFTHELISGEDTDGADDWQWGTPNGKGGDPDFSYSGDNAWGNDLGNTIGNQQWNGEYQNSKHNRLSSVAISTEGYEELVLQYRRWLTIEDGYYDSARVLVDGDTAWENHGTSQAVGDEHHADEQWQLHTMRIADGDESGDIDIAWEIETDQGLAMGGWNIDDVCLYAVGYTEPPSETDPTPSLEPGEQGIAPTGCGCTSTNPTGLGLAGAAMGLAVFIRRRRRHSG
ncbi:MAG TPA: MYXO-CTERM sorting domain-containing protein [Myxococcota bacterium]|nr:MYXO-CTERM sorting domain-containing protein [Myxococcota bacterium]